jgi:hypothetical protein
MSGVPITQESERVLISRLLDEAMAGKIAAGRVSRDEVLLVKQCLCACIVASCKVDLGQPESIAVIACCPRERLVLVHYVASEPAYQSSLAVCQRQK